MIASSWEDHGFQRLCWLFINYLGSSKLEVSELELSGFETLHNINLQINAKNALRSKMNDLNLIFVKTFKHES